VTRGALSNTSAQSLTLLHRCGLLGWVPQLTRWVPLNAIRVDRLNRAFSSFREVCAVRDVPDNRWMKVHRAHELWEFEEIDEFFDELRREPGVAELVEEYPQYAFSVLPESEGMSVTLRLPSRQAIDEILRHLDLSPTNLRAKERPAFKVFVGYGRNIQWRVLTEHLRARHGFWIETYETAATVGQPAMDVLQRLGAEVSFALLVHTAEVIGAGDSYHAGPNVIHETGYFQAQLGMSRALIIREENCHPFANIAGLTELRFRTGGIEGVFGEVVALLRAANLAG
jgi:hypothetical protein